VLRLRFALLRAQSSNPLYHRVHPAAEKRARRLFARQLGSGSERLILAEHAGDAIGILRCAEIEGSPLLLPERYAYVSSAYVVPEWRRQGVLRHLLTAAEDWAARRGLSEMRLSAAVDSPMALAAWRELGFEPAEQLHVRPIGGRHGNA
jgi:ribosomal protein S18 acetylase RimI-like enzyme